MVASGHDSRTKKTGKFVANLRVGFSIAISMNFVSFALEGTCSLMLLAYLLVAFGFREQVASSAKLTKTSYV